MVPAEFWLAPEMQAALGSEHMGAVVRAYRRHHYHGPRGPTQDTVARWVGRTQAVISKLENGPPPSDLQTLRFWANLLRIPQRYLWFKLSQTTDAFADSPLGQINDLTVHEFNFLARQVADIGAELAEQLRSRPQAAHSLPGDDAASQRPALAGSALAGPISIDIDQAQGPRMGDYLLGGHSNFRVDREMIHRVTSALPGGVETARAVTHASQDFQRRALRWLAGEAGIRQFMQTGARLPKHIRPHQIIAEHAPEARVLYVLDDDTVLAHARGLQQDSGAANTRWIRANLHDMFDLLAKARPELDFTAPLGVLTGGSLRVFDHEAAREVIAQLVASVASGSYLVTSHLTTETLGVEMSEVVYRFKQAQDEGKMPYLALRTRDEIAQLLDGLELVEPGIVPADHWRPEQPPGPHTFVYGAVARKP